MRVGIPYLHFVSSISNRGLLGTGGLPHTPHLLPPLQVEDKSIAFLLQRKPHAVALMMLWFFSERNLPERYRQELQARRCALHRCTAAPCTPHHEP